MNISKISGCLIISILLGLLAIILGGIMIYNHFADKFTAVNVIPQYVSKVDTGSCALQTTLSNGIISVPAKQVTNLYGKEWTIMSWIKINTSALNEPFTFIHMGKVGPNTPDLKMSYDPVTKDLELGVTNSFGLMEMTVIPSKMINLNNWNHFCWVQRPGIQQVYINGTMVVDKGMIAPPKINRNSVFLIESMGVVKFVNFKICSKAWRPELIQEELINGPLYGVNIAY